MEKIQEEDYEEEEVFEHQSVDKNVAQGHNNFIANDNNDHQYIVAKIKSTY